MTDRSGFMRLTFKWWVVVGLVAGTAGAATWLAWPAVPAAGPFTDHRHTQEGTEFAYSVYCPEPDRLSRRYPLVVFLHGYGDRGPLGNQNYLKVGLPYIVRLMHRQGKAADFIAVFPQSQCGHWDPYSVEARAVDSIRRKVEEEFPVDRRRVYLTGISNGGCGVWNVALTLPGRWAAIAPVCGDFPEGNAQALASVPCWAFHGTGDEVIPVEPQRRAVRELVAAGGDARLTEFPDVDHAVWGKVYLRPDLYKWLFSKTLKD